MAKKLSKTDHIVLKCAKGLGRNFTHEQLVRAVSEHCDRTRTDWFGTDKASDWIERTHRKNLIIHEIKGDRVFYKIA